MSPYITKEQRVRLHADYRDNIPKDAGELNYKITIEIQGYLEHKIGNTPMQLEPNYSDYNEIIGVLECVKQELYRRVIGKYEDKKCKENGEVFDV